MRIRANIILLSIVVFACHIAPSSAQTKGWPRAMGGAQASPLAVDLDADGKLEVIVPAFDDRLYVFNHDGTYFTGWPQTLMFDGSTTGSGTIGSAAVGDVDGDGNLEIVVAGSNTSHESARINVYTTTGTLVQSKALDNNTNAAAKGTVSLVDCYRYSGSTRHDALEIVLRDGDGQLHVLKWNGSSFDDLFVDNNTYKTATGGTAFQDRFGSQPINASVTARYMGSDETYLLVGSTDDKIYRWKATSTTGTNWSLSTLAAIDLNLGDTVRFLGSITFADVDGDADRDIIAGATDGKARVWDGASWDGGAPSLLTGWPQSTGQAITSSAAVGDIDDDNEVEIVIGSNDGKIYAWNDDGTAVTGWPIATGGDIFGSPVLAEVDGVSGLEVIAGSLDAHLYLWTGAGALISRWPQNLNTPLYSSPSVVDLHGGGRISIVVAGYEGRLFVLDLPYHSSDTSAGWQQFRGGTTRDGVAP